MTHQKSNSDLDRELEEILDSISEKKPSGREGGKGSEVIGVSQGEIGYDHSLNVVCDFGQLVQEMKSLTKRYNSGESYSTLRNDYLRASLELNKLGLIAPAFRHQPKIPFYKNKRSDDHKQLLVDQIIIDCHWLHCKGCCVNCKHVEYDELFDKVAKPFDFDLALKFAKSNWKREFRANDMLGLTQFQQFQMLQLCSKENRDHLKRLVDGDCDRTNKVRTPAEEVAVRRAVNAWAERKPQIRDQRHVYVALWRSRELLGYGAPVRQIGALTAMMIGAEQLADRTIRDKLVNLDRVLGKQVEEV